MPDTHSRFLNVSRGMSLLRGRLEIVALHQPLLNALYKKRNYFAKGIQCVFCLVCSLINVTDRDS
jgi:hypothetical protein